MLTGLVDGHEETAMVLTEKGLSPVVPSGHGGRGGGAFLPFCPVTTTQMNIQDFHHPERAPPARQLSHPKGNNSSDYWKFLKEKTPRQRDLHCVKMCVSQEALE